MIKSEHKLKVIITALLAAAMLTGCASGVQDDTSSAASAGLSDLENSKSASGSGNISDVSVPKITSGDITFPELPSEAVGIKGDTYITMSDDGVTVQGEGAAVVGSVVTISAAGDYVVTGTLTDGKIVVDSADTDKVTVILNGAAVACSTGAAIYIIGSEAAKVVIEAADGSVNLLYGGVAKTAADTSVEDAAIFSREDLKLTGSGILYVNGVYRGIESKDDLEVEKITLYITSGDDGLRGKDSIEITSGAVTIDAGADGLRTDNTEDEGKGYITVSGGSLSVNASDDAVQAVTDLTVSGGELALVSGGGSSNAAAHSSDKGGFFNWGNADKTETDDSVSGKALKAEGVLTISGGSFNIDSVDDALHSNGSLTVNGGTLTISAGDDGMHANNSLDISNGTIDITQSYEGIESAAIGVSGGTITLSSYDDGFNSVMNNSSASANKMSASNQTLSSTVTQTAGGRGGIGGGGMGGGGFGGGGFRGGGMESSDGSTLKISGGKVTINAGGDGLDCNGDMTINGGYTIVYGPTDDGNGPLDYAGTFYMNGGTLLAIGSSGMAQSSDSASDQACLFFTVNGSANQNLIVRDSSGNVLIEVTSPKKYACVYFSSPDIISGSSYTVTHGSASGTIKAS